MLFSVYVGCRNRIVGRLDSERFCLETYWHDMRGRPGGGREGLFFFLLLDWWQSHV